MSRPTTSLSAFPHRATQLFLILFCGFANAAVQPSIEGKFTPPDGKALLFIGQDSDTIADYQREVPQDAVEGVTLYTSLKSADPTEALPAVFSAANWQAGDVDFARTLAGAPGAALAIGLAIDQCDQAKHAERIAKGDYDASLDKLVGYLKSLAPRKVFLRIGYEFDGLWNCYDPKSYKDAFRHIMGKVKAAQADNVASVWQSATWPEPAFAGERTHLYDHRDPGHFDKWYPGNEWVDWVGISAFYLDLSQWQSTPSYTPQFAQSKALAFARAQQKPIMIAEAAPQGYRVKALTHSYIMHNQQASRTAEDIWQNWYAPFFDFVTTNRDVIRAVAYINTHWDSQPMWMCADGARAAEANCANGNWGDSRVQGNELIKSRWLKEVNNQERWVQSADY